MVKMLTGRDAYLITPCETNVTVQELIDAVCNLLDGTEDHDIHNMTGLSEPECKRLADIRKAISPLWSIHG